MAPTSSGFMAVGAVLLAAQTSSSALVCAAMRSAALPRRTAELAACAVAEDSQQLYLSRLAEWIAGAGGDVSRVRIGDVDGMRGGVLNKPPSAFDDELMAVPAALALSDDIDVLIDTPVGSAIGRAGLALLQPDAHLALRLLHEDALGAASPWRDYLCVLPDRVRTARHLTDDALLACRSSFVLEQSMLARKYASNLYGTLKRLLETSALAAASTASVGASSPGDAAAPPLVELPFNEERLGWALDMVHSRSFSVDVGGPRGVRRFMVPYIDMLNHSPRHPGCAFSYDDSEEPPCFVVQLMQPDGTTGGEASQSGEVGVDVGSQLWLDYGPVSSDELLLMYGFVPSAPTPHDSVELEGAYTPADLEAAPGSDATLDAKRALLASCRYAAPRSFCVRADGNIDPAVICALRLIYLETEDVTDGTDDITDDVAGLSDDVLSRALRHAPLSAANERRVAEALRLRLSDELDASGTPLEFDLQVLGGEAAAWEELADLEGEEVLHGEPREQMRSAVQIRANRKMVLAESVTRLDGFLTRCDQGGGEGGRALNLLDECFEDYMPNIRMT